MLGFMQARRKRAQEEGGFTLIELLVVIVILGILAAVVVFAVGGIQDRGQGSACDAEEKTVEVAQEAYFAKYGGYAASATALTQSPDKVLRETPTWPTTSSTGAVVATGKCA